MAGNRQTAVKETTEGKNREHKRKAGRKRTV